VMAVFEKLSPNGSTATVDLLAELARIVAEVRRFADFAGDRVAAMTADEWRHDHPAWLQVQVEVSLYERALDRTARVLTEVTKLDLEGRAQEEHQREIWAAEAVARKVVDFCGRMLDLIGATAGQLEIWVREAPAQLRAAEAGELPRWDPQRSGGLAAGVLVTADGFCHVRVAARHCRTPALPDRTPDAAGPQTRDGLSHYPLDGATVSDKAGNASSGDQTHWRASRTLADLGELTAQWLEGRLASHPTGALEAETAPIASILAECNRAGFVTENRQPGEWPDGHGNAQRAAVFGFIDAADLAELARLLNGTGVIVVAHAGAGEEDGFDVHVVITLDRGEEFSWEGARIGLSSLAFHYGDWCHPVAVAALAHAWQVSLIDPVWGRNGLIWPALGTFASRDRP
jgi:uncharacterized protein DUF6919